MKQHGTEKDDDFQYIAEASHPRHGFSHLGFCMSNLPEVTKRLQAAGAFEILSFILTEQNLGVEIIKPQGVADAQAIGFPSDIEKPRQEWVDLFKNMIMIKDPEYVLSFAYSSHLMCFVVDTGSRLVGLFFRASSWQLKAHKQFQQSCMASIRCSLGKGTL